MKREYVIRVELFGEKEQFVRNGYYNDYVPDNGEPNNKGHNRATTLAGAKKYPTSEAAELAVISILKDYPDDFFIIEPVYSK